MAVRRRTILADDAYLTCPVCGYRDALPASDYEPAPGGYVATWRSDARGTCSECGTLLRPGEDGLEAEEAL